MSAALHQVTVIFIAVISGFICRKVNVITEEGTSALSNIVVKLILPFYLFNAILSSSAGVNAAGVGTALALSAGMFILSGLIALVGVPILKPKPDDRGVYMFETMCGNVTYLGIPVCTAVFGESAGLYASLLNIPYNLLCFSLGIFLLAGRVSFKKALNPAFLSGLAAAVLYILGVKPPQMLMDACAFIGQATSPCAMLIIGSVLADIPLGELFTDWRAIPYVLMRLFGIAAIVWLLLIPVNIDHVLKQVLTIMAAMPAAINATMLCTIYGGNRALSAKLIFLSTAISLLTIPLWASFLS